MENLTISGNINYKFNVTDDVIARLNLIFNDANGYEKITEDFIYKIFNGGPHTEFERAVYDELVNWAIEISNYKPDYNYWHCTKLIDSSAGDGVKISKEDYIELFEHMRHID